MTRAAALSILLVLPVLLTPSALADHAYSHRYVVFGRVLDENGAPAPGLEVIGAPTFGYEGPCVTHPEARTDAWGAEAFSRTNERGEFWLCYHAHVLSAASPGEVRLDVRGPTGESLARETLSADPLMRVSFVDLRIPGSADGDATLLDGEHLVAGRVWSPWVSGEKLDGVPVEGLALKDLPVNVSVRDGDTQRTAATRTNAYGDFAVRVPLDAPLTDAAVVRVEYDGTHAERPANATGWTTFKLTSEPRAEFILVAQEHGDGQFAWHFPGNATANPDLRVLPNARVSIIVVNGGNATHTFQVMGEEPAPALDARGEFLAYNFTAPAQGTVAYWGVEHRDAGMEGQLVVADVSPRVPTPTPGGGGTMPTASPPSTSPTPTTITETPAAPIALVLLVLLAVAIARRRV